jgi:hypothetical protein
VMFGIPCYECDKNCDEAQREACGAFPSYLKRAHLAVDGAPVCGSKVIYNEVGRRVTNVTDDPAKTTCRACKKE